MTVSWKRSVWQNPDQERTNQDSPIYLRTTLPYNKGISYCSQYVNISFPFLEASSYLPGTAISHKQRLHV